MRTPLFIILIPLAFVLSACGSSSSSESNVTDSAGDDVERTSSGVDISNARLTEGNASGTNMVFTVSLDIPAIGDVSVGYATRDGSANAGTDYEQSSGTVAIADGENSASISVMVYGDTILELNETFFVDITNPSENAFFGGKRTRLTATGTILTDDGATSKFLNDTGSSFSGIDPSGNNSGCIGVMASEQDCSFGRDQDVSTNSDTDGYVGFSFTKLDASGNSLTASAPEWACIRDNVTNLTWEVKQLSGSHDTGNMYYWKEPGTVGDGVTDATSCSTPSDAAGHSDYCSSSAFVLRANAEAYCGISGWRLPRTNELLNIANLDTKEPAIDTLFFPNTQNDNYMTSYVRTLFSARVTDVVDFTLGSVNNMGISVPYYIRLVSDSPPPAPAAGGGSFL